MAPTQAGGAQVAPIPVSAARAEREAAAAARRSGVEPLEIARRVAAVLNAGPREPKFMWLTGLTTDGTIVVANNYGLGYISPWVKLPAPVKFAFADESIPIAERAKWVTFPIAALQGWAESHHTALRAVIAMEDQFEGFDSGCAEIKLQPDDIPTAGKMEGRSRLEVLAPDVAIRLASVPDTALADLLPPPPADPEPPEDRRMNLLMEVFRPLLSSDSGRIPLQLKAMAEFADHMQKMALHSAYTAADAEALRIDTEDAIYWQHVGVLSRDALGTMPEGSQSSERHRSRKWRRRVTRHAFDLSGPAESTRYRGCNAT
ncbi:secretion protein EccK [Mycolicibacterium smegmatis]|uniref:secretion protein EccK n=2 Tax=Mycolicibacterium smegmatis TaxID=1772 RepID=UPI000A9BB6ED|nr:secretion protein EccK [Mycolicibacterium smegmatis]MBF4140416.1 secretion protein EccK [Mycolicibacterium smegmatis]QKU06263.1 secretion protein EccK [Mycolicibacterium smegmatis]ULN29755.1 secretion protein EccK [Mycolicibacterium smegmatis]